MMEVKHELKRVTATPPNPKSEIEVKFKCEVFYTQKYSLFRYLEGQRKIDLVTLNQVVESAKEEWLINPIIVNEKWEIIEGQHRFEAAKQLNLPVYFIQIPYYGISQTYRLNTIGKKWDALTFADSYAKMGNPHYQTFIDFKKKYNFDSRGLMQILLGSGASKFAMNMKAFGKGEFVVEDVENAHRKAQMILDYEKGYPGGTTRRSFVAAALRLMNHKLYNHDHMIKQLEKKAFPIYHFPNAMQYLEVLVKIFNYGKHGEKIVGF